MGDPQLLFDFPETGWVLRYGGLIQQPDGWIVAGSVEDTNAGIDQIDERMPRVFSVKAERVDTLPPPSALAEAPVPVSLGGNRWGIIWATSNPAEQYKKNWLEGLFTDLWWAERNSGGWSTPKRILHADFGVDWEVSRNIQVSNDGSAYVLVMGRDSALRRTLYFGNIHNGLSPLDVPSGEPLAAGFSLAGETAIRLVIAVRGAEARTAQIIEAMVSVPSRSFVAQHVIAEADARSIGHPLRVVQAPNGPTHVLWSSQDLTRIHGFTEQEDGSWKPDDPPDPGALLFEWEAKPATACDRAVIYGMVMDARGNLGLRVSMWEGAWGEFTLRYPEQVAVYLLEGTSFAGQPLVGWSGNSSIDTLTTFGFWAVKP